MKKGEIDMGRIIKNLLLLLCVQSAMLALVGCHHKDLCVHHLHTVKVKVEYNWQNAPQANPTGMTLYFYPVDGGSPQRFDFIGKEGGYINLVKGKYNVITYNNDTEAILYNKINEFDNHYAYTRAGSILEPVYASAAAPPKADADEERVVITPDMLWGCTATEVLVTDSGIEYICIPVKDKDNHKYVENKEHIITLYPAEQMCLYSYEIRNIEDIHGAVQMSASLGGMSGGLTFATEELNRECVTLPFEGKIIPDSCKVTGEFFTFGHHPQNTKEHRMLLYVWMKDGKAYCIGKDDKKFDVTEQVHNAQNPRRVHIIIDSLKLPYSEPVGGSFVPEIDDWEVEYNDILM